jgi:hypothetical protein
MHKVEDWVAWIFGVTGGCFAFLHIPQILTIDWSIIISGALKLLWTGLVAVMSGAMGVVGKKLVENSGWLKKIFHKKSKS